MLHACMQKSLVRNAMEEDILNILLPKKKKIILIALVRKET